MLIDLTLKVTPKMAEDAGGNERKALIGHLGTHFDVMDREFPLEYTQRQGLVFDVSGTGGREVGREDVDLSRVERGMFIAFYTGFMDREPYGTKAYFSEHPVLADGLIDALLEKEVSLIGIDCAGIRRGRDHVPADQRCADRGVFVIENLCGLKDVLAQGGRFLACTYPVNFAGMTGLPCRVVARI